MRYAPCAAVAVFLLTSAGAHAQHVSVELIPDVSAVEPGGKVTVAAVFKIEKGWHVYWINPGDTGTPPRIKWIAPAGVTVGPSQFPTPETINASGLTAYGYEHSLALLHEITIPKDASGEIELKADASWVVCSDVCVAERQSVRLKLPVAEKRGEPNQPRKFETWRSEQPNRLDKPVIAAIDADGKHGTVEMKVPPGLTLAEFFPPAADFLEWEKPKVEGKQVRVRFRVLPNPPASHAADAITVFKGPSGQVAVIQQVQFKFQVPHKE